MLMPTLTLKLTLMQTLNLMLMPTPPMSDLPLQQPRQRSFPKKSLSWRKKMLETIQLEKRH
jgi:hypothetical protein